MAAEIDSGLRNSVIRNIMRNDRLSPVEQAQQGYTGHLPYIASGEGADNFTLRQGAASREVQHVSTKGTVTRSAGRREWTVVRERVR